MQSQRISKYMFSRPETIVGMYQHFARNCYEWASAEFRTAYRANGTTGILQRFYAITQTEEFSRKLPHIKHAVDMAYKDVMGNTPELDLAPLARIMNRIN